MSPVGGRPRSRRTTLSITSRYTLAQSINLNAMASVAYSALQWKTGRELIQSKFRLGRLGNRGLA